MVEQTYFYTVKPIMQKVAKSEFEKFLSNYPRPLERDVFGACEPPAVSYNDFQLAAKWPYSVVAKTFLYSDNKKDYYYEEESNRVYEIMGNYEEVFASKTGNREEDVEETEQHIALLPTSELEKCKDCSFFKNGCGFSDVDEKLNLDGNFAACGQFRKKMTQLEALRIAYEQLSNMMPYPGENDEIFEAADIIEKMIKAREAKSKQE